LSGRGLVLISRKKFLQIGAGSIAGIALSNLWLPKLLNASNAKNGKGRLPVIWFQAQACSGCAVSLINTAYPGIDDVLIEVITLEFNPVIMGAQGDLSLDVIDRMMSKEKGKYILVVEGSVPVEEDGLYCTVGERGEKPVTALQWVKLIGQNSMAVVSVGTCASWGGIPAAPPNPTGALPVSKVVEDKPIINIPGCPPHPDWIIGTIIHVLKYGIPELDKVGRPVMFYGTDKLIHDNCELRQYFDTGVFAKDFGQEGCLYELGCKGPVAHCDVSTRGWNNKVNWCNRSGGPCIGCTEPFFPGGTGSGLYEKLPSAEVPGLEKINASANTIGIALGGAVVAGIGAHAAARMVATKYRQNKEEKTREKGTPQILKEDKEENKEDK
jgi:hydrogenase small subunit